ncbi:MAG: L-histidine N(alpha)-methyltransferase [Rhizobiales bacterium 32-66-8]|nr:MAG: L-histidine N(alpha)-methyltransferase [Rhizobiales bacterium 32-66-8]
MSRAERSDLREPAHIGAADGDSAAQDLEVFRADVLSGLSAHPKALSAKYFYDAAGSRLFDAICELDEYYPTRTELKILKAHAGDIAARAGSGATLVEFGAGSLVKVRLLLEALRDPTAYVPIDISQEHLLAASGVLAREYRNLTVLPLVADFTRAVQIPAHAGSRMLGFFPGSTLGNFTPADATAFLRQAGETLGPSSLFVLGIDLKKDTRRLEAAYNDRKGVTAAFNLNLLTRINRELAGTFDLSAFLHRAVFNTEEGRIEMHLESLADQTVEVAGQRVSFVAGETIHTENSYKYSTDDITARARAAGWQVEHVWTDPHALFAVCLLARD